MSSDPYFEVGMGLGCDDLVADRISWSVGVKKGWEDPLWWKERLVDRQGDSSVRVIKKDRPW